MIEPQLDPKLIFDVGLHRGEDTDFYLKKGFRVVAFEANANLVSFCETRFQREIDEGKLTIISGAIVPRNELEAGKETVSFYRNDGLSVWGTVRKDWAERNESLGASSTCVEVPVVDFAAAIREHGVPFYMKIDIEGCDTVCLETLLEFSARPSFVSIESSKLGIAAIREELGLLTKLGYNSFKVVEQSQIHLTQKMPAIAREGMAIEYVFEEGASGLFGRELAGDWMTRTQAFRRYRIISLLYYLFGDSGLLSRCVFPGSGRIKMGVSRCLSLLLGRASVGWYDTHAKHRDFQ